MYLIFMNLKFTEVNEHFSKNVRRFISEQFLDIYGNIVSIFIDTNTKSKCKIPDCHIFLNKNNNIQEICSMQNNKITLYGDSDYVTSILDKNEIKDLAKMLK